MSESTPSTSPPPAGAASPASPASPAGPANSAASNFITDIIDADNASGRWGKTAAGLPKVVTRFPPEPNGYLHIGHAKSICLNYGLATRYQGVFNLRFDDTNPTKEEVEYIESIKCDVKWLGAHFDNPTRSGGGLFYASELFGKMYEFACELIKKGKAYVCELSGEEVSAQRGKPGVPATSPHRDRGSGESIRLFAEMKEGKHPDGKYTLRARIDLASPNFNLRDPVMYRILHGEHPHTGRQWCIYPMYDWAHGIEDSVEGITHSVCTLEFEDHRPLYDWFIASINDGRTTDGSGPFGKTIHHPQQIEFARLNLTYTVMSKRFLLKLVQDKVVAGWDDPRMPTLAGMRRRGYPASAIRAFCDDIGVTKQNSMIDVGRLENAVREVLNKNAPRAMAVLRPLKVIIENWAAGTVDHLDFVINPEDPTAGTRKIPFSGELYIEQEDFMEVPAKKFFRLAPGAEVRLRWGFFITCVGVDKDAAGNITSVRCTYDPATRGGDSPVGPDGLPLRKVKGTIHWVSAAHAMHAQVHLLERLFNTEAPGQRTGNQTDDLNPASLETVTALIDPILTDTPPGTTYQFERLGYFTVDTASAPGKPVFNRTVTLKDAWAAGKK